MDCLKDNIKSDLMQGIKSAVKRENEIFIPFTDSKGRNKTYGLAQSKINQINKAYNSKVFGEAVSLNTSYSDGIGINIHVPKALRNAYDYRIKKAESEKLKQESRQQQIKDAERAGIEYDEDYLFQKNSKLQSVVYTKEVKEALLKVNFNQTVNQSEINKLPINSKAKQYLNFVIDKNKNIKTYSDLVNTVYNNKFKNEYYTLFTQQVNPELEKKLIDFLKQFHFDIEETTLNKLKQEFGLNILGVTDIINKTIKVVGENERNVLTLPEEISHAVFELIGSNYRNSDIGKKLYQTVSEWEGYKTIYNEYSNIYKDAEGNVDWKKVQKEAIGKALAMALINYNSESYIKLPLEVKLIIDKIVNFIRKLLGMFLKNINQIEKNIQFKNLINEIASNVLNNNLDYFKTYNDEGFSTTDYLETIQEQNKEDGGKAVKLMQLISKNNGAVTGSLSLRKVSQLKRSKEGLLHDIDTYFNAQDLFGLPITRKLTQEEFENTELFDDLKNEYGDSINYFTNWFHEGENYNALHYYITNPEIDKKFKAGKEKELSLSQIYESLSLEEQKETILIDFFIEPKQVKTIHDDVYNINLTTPEYSYLPKLFVMGRNKDVYDYQNLKYFDNKFKIDDKRNFMFQLSQDESEDTSFEPKEGVSELFKSNPELASIGTEQQYSQYLDTIFPDSKVKDIVYHGTNAKFDNFDKKYLSKYDVGYYGKGFYFSTKPNNAYSDKNYHRQEVDGVILSVLLNLPNPNYKASNDFSDTGKDIVKNKGVIVIDENLDNELTEKTTNPDEFVKALLKLGKYDIDQIVVSEPEQIHILGSQQDIEGFKKFTESKSFDPKEESDVEKANTYTRDSLKEIADGSGLAKKGTEILNPDKVASQLKVGDKIIFYAERERIGIWDGKTIREEKTNNPFGILGILSDINGYIKNQSKIDASKLTRQQKSNIQIDTSEDVEKQLEKEKEEALIAAKKNQKGDKIEWILESWNKREEPFRSSKIVQDKIVAISKDGNAWLSTDGKWHEFSSKRSAIIILNNFSKNERINQINKYYNEKIKSTIDDDINISDEFVDDEFNFDDLASEYAASQEQKTQEEPGIDTDTTLDDEVITNFDKVLSYKKSLVSKIKDRIANVQAIIKDTTDKEEALSFARKENQLQERLEQLENDIADTESGYSYGKLKFQAQQDLQRLQTLLESENVNDINEAKRIINFYKAMSFDAKKVTLDNDPITSHPIFFEEEIFDENGKMQLPQQTIDFFGNLSKAFASYEAQLEQKQKRALENIINSHPTIKQLYSENLTYKHLTAPTGDISWVDMMIMDPSKTISANNLIPQIMMDITQRVFAEKISKAKQFEEKHNKALVKAEKALTGMGKALTVLGFSNPSFDIFFQKSMGRNTGRLVHRYNQEFFDSRANMQADFKEQLRLIRTSGLDEKAKNKLLKQAYQERQQWFRENVIVFDIRRLREVREAFPDLADTYFDEVDDAHRKELIDNLGSEQAYKEEVDKQIRQIKKYFIWKESNREMVFEENGVETFEELSEDAKADLLFNEAVKSPFTGTDYFYYGDVQIGNKFVNTSMEYNISVPRRYKPTSVKQDKSGRYIAKGQEESTGYYDKQFEQIEKNKDLYEYYKIVQEQMSTILNSFPTEVQEKLFTNSLPTVQKTFREILADPNISLYKKLYNALVDFYDRIRGGFGIKPQSSISFDNEDVITGKTEPTINAEFLNNNKSKINDLLDMELIKANNLLKAAGSKLKVKKNGTLDLYKLPQNIIKLISEKTNLAPTYDAIKAKYGERVPVGKILENSVMADIIQDSSTDLPKIIRYYNMMAAEYTARQQLLPYMEMMKNHYTQIQKPKTNKQGVGVTNVFSQAGQTEGVRTRANTQMEDWFNRVILGNRDVKAFGVIDSENVDPKTVKEKIGNLISGRILDKKDRELNKKLNEMINNTKDQNEIDKLLKIKAGLGKQFAASAAFENLFNYIRYLGLGYNLSSGITNYMEGQIANMIIAATGDHFESHHYYRALNIVKGSLFKSITGNTNLSTQGSRKLRVLVDRYNILQDSTNELQKASVKTSLDVLDKFNPMEINKRTEYLNQTPLMISVMLSTEITGDNNQKSNVWDALDMNGKLLPEFRTEENIKAWELGEGEMFTSFKTKTSQAIGMAHGMGYDNLRGMMAKSSTIGKALTMFKTWVGSQLYTRFASERDDAELGIKGYKGRYRSHTKASLSIMGGIVGWGFAATTGLGVGALAGLGVGALIGKRTGIKSNLGTLREYAFLGKAIARKLIGMPVNFIGSSFTGKQVMKEFVGYEKLIKEGKLGEGKFTERDAKNMKALVTEMSLQIAWIALALIAKGMLWDDDDEEDSPERIAHNLIVNRSLQVLSSSNMYVTPDVFTQIVGEQGTARFFTDVVKFVAAAQEWTEGNDTITRGINAGDSRTANTFYKIALPSAVRDSYFGFASQMERQFEKTSYDDWFFDDTKKANKLLESKRAAYKQELINEHGFDEEKDKKKITKLLNKRFPLLKDIKDPESKK